MRNRRQLTLWVIAAALLAASVASLLLRNPITGLAAARALARQGWSCDPVQARVPLALPPATIKFAPMRCVSAAGPLQSIQFQAPSYVVLSGLGVVGMHCASVTIALRPQPHRDVELNTLGDMTGIVGLNEPAIELLFDAAQMSARKIMPLTFANATVLRAGQPIASLNDLRVTSTRLGLALTVRSMHAHQISALGEAALQLTASPDQALAGLDFNSHLHLKVTAEHLKARRPDVRFEIAHGAGDSRSP